MLFDVLVFLGGGCDLNPVHITVDPVQLALDMVPGGPLVQGLVASGSAAYSYVRSPGPHNVAGFVGDVAVAGVGGVLPGPSVVGRQASGAGVSAGQKAIGPGTYGALPALPSANSKLQNLSPTPLSSSQIDDYLGGMKERGIFHKSSKYEQWHINGGIPDLKRNFDDLSTGVEVRSLTIKDSEARMSKLSDGSIMLERPISEGSPTLELKRPKGSKDIKFRYKG
ncbi:hypothetical protein [Rothia nasisuis]|uniref:hypothetical protein n=1 Tax=Rothia nasisuis TaxID=2109647 RepID=UPI001F46EFF4|nr:hypothetical protein [Rothia nasisuis]